MRPVIVHRLSNPFGYDFLIVSLNHCGPDDVVDLVASHGVVTKQIGVKHGLSYHLGDEVHGWGLYTHVPCDLHTFLGVADYHRLTHVLNVQKLREDLLKEGL
jgi:hypothetical protein